MAPPRDIPCVKVAHLADPHLGARQYHRQTPAGINQREADVARAFRLAIDGVIAAQPDLGRRGGRSLPLGAADQCRDRVRLPPAAAAAGSPARRADRADRGQSRHAALGRDRVHPAALRGARAWTSRPTRPGVWSTRSSTSRCWRCRTRRSSSPSAHRSDRKARRGASCWCCTARSRASSPSTAAAVEYGGAVARPQRAGAGASGATWRWATITCGTRWRRAPGTPGRSST